MGRYMALRTALADTSRQKLSSSLSAWQREQSMKSAVQLLTFSSITNAFELI
jgi:hypothetical protein